MVDLPKKKVGIVACSGEELPEGTVTRLAALRILEELRAGETVTICLPLFLAGGEGDRAFARFYPTIALDGCELRCAARATEMYSGKPAASLVVSELLAEKGMPAPSGCHRLDEAGQRAVDVAAEKVAGLVDELLGKSWSRRRGEFTDLEPVPIMAAREPVIASCSCGSGIPTQEVLIEGKTVPLIALPLIFEQFRQEGKNPSGQSAPELLDAVKIYNSIPQGAEQSYTKAVLREYAAFLEREAAR